MGTYINISLQGMFSLVHVPVMTLIPCYGLFTFLRVVLPTTT